MVLIIPVIALGEQFGWYSILNKDARASGIIIFVIIMLGILLKIFMLTLSKIYTRSRKYLKYQVINRAIDSGSGLIFIINKYFKKMCPKITLKD